jgi:hypothetical protein
LYSITRDGRVWAHERITKHNTSRTGYQVFKPHWLKWGRSGQYPAVMLYRLSRAKRLGDTHYIHHLVMLVWGPLKPSPEYEINHIDLNKDNAYVGNLEWVTSAGNSAHAMANGHYSEPPHRRGTEANGAKLSEANVLEIRIRHANGESQNALGRAFGVSGNQINLIVRRKAWTHI